MNWKYLITDPFLWCWVLLVAGGLIHRRMKRVWTGWAWRTGVVLFLLCSTPFFPNAMLNRLESSYPVLQPDEAGLRSEQRVNILVLGAGHTDDPALPATMQLLPEAMGRLNEAIRLSRYFENGKIIVSGYAGGHAASQAEVLKRAGMELGFPDTLFELQEEPTNTVEEARAYLNDHGHDEQLILVTSAAHMPRAMWVFHELGAAPVAAPAMFQLKYGPGDGIDWLPSAEHFRKTDKVIHEWLGLWYDKYFLL